jgi:hypothetical protein
MRISAGGTREFDWLKRRTGCAATDDFNTIKATDARGMVRGVVGYCNWTKNAVQVHMAADTPIVWRSLLRPALEYPFVQVGVGILLGCIRSKNASSISLVRTVGFEATHSIKDGHCKGEDLLFFELRKENCRYLLTPDLPWVTPAHIHEMRVG